MDGPTVHVIEQLRTIEQQVQEVTCLVENGACSLDIIHRITAIQISLDPVRTFILENYLHTCLAAACEERNQDGQAQALDRIARVLNSS